MEKEKLVLLFNRFATVEAKNNSPLYAYWCSQIVGDDSLLNLIRHIPVTQPMPNLFFASVQYLALQTSHALADVFRYPEKVELDGSFQLLKDFCNQYQEELIHLFATKLVQTNEVQRAAYLYPIFSDIFQRVSKPLSLIEIGTSAGLLLNLDFFQYEIQQDQVIQYGHEESSLKINATNFGDSLKAVRRFPIANRLGIDLNIMDLTCDEDYQWLQCLIWPEQQDRKENLKKAREIHIKCEKTLWQGDFTKLIPKYVVNQKDDAQIVIFHTHVANQFPSELKDALLAMLQQLSKTHTIYHVYNNLFDTNLHVDSINLGETTPILELENTDGHGNYFYWKDFHKVKK